MKPMILMLILLALVVSACTTSQEDAAHDLPAGNAGRGAALFTQSVSGAPACSACHSVDGTALVGPALQGYGLTASTRKTGVNAQVYTYTSIVRPGADLVDGFSNVMYSQYDQRLSDQQLADLIAYLLTL